MDLSAFITRSIGFHCYGGYGDRYNTSEIKLTLTYITLSIEDYNQLIRDQRNILIQGT